MEEQRRGRQGPRPSGSRTARAVAALAATAVLLAACGGDGGGGNGATGHTLHALIVNGSEADVTVTYTGTEPVEITQATCTADIHDFPLADPFTIAIDGETVLDSFEDLPEGLPNQGESDLIVAVEVDKEGAATFDRVRPGSGLSKPSKAAYCPTLP
jgi:hypothetical protein